MRPAVHVFVAGSAEADLDSIADYFGSRNPTATEAMLSRISNTMQLLATHPRVGHHGRVTGTRELVVTGTPFVLVYTIDGEALIVMRVLHAQQQWPPA